MTGRKHCALQVPPVVLYKAIEKFSKALYGTTGGTCSAQFFRPVTPGNTSGEAQDLNKSFWSSSLQTLSERR